MRKYYILGLIALVCIIIGFAWADQASLTTYYPAPDGVYRQMKLYPTDVFAPGGGCADKGALYFDDSENEIQVCNGVFWQRLGGGGRFIPVPGYWPIDEWGELDLSPIVGVRSALVVLKVTCASGIQTLFAKPFSDPDTYDRNTSRPPMNSAYVSLPGEYELLMVHTDDQGKLGLKSSGLTTGWDIEVVAYF